MRRSKDGSRKVWIKRHLKAMLGLSERQMRRYFKGGYGPTATSRFLSDHGYKAPLDRRTRAYKAKVPAKVPVLRVPTDDTLC